MTTRALQAEMLNKIITRENHGVFMMLSERGKEICFPHEGILGQTAEARGTEYNATIGMACEDDSTIMALNAMTNKVLLNKDLIVPYASSFGKKELRERWRELLEVKNNGLQKKMLALLLLLVLLRTG